MPSVLFDAMIVPDGELSATELQSLGQAVEFVKDQYRHCKPMLFLGAGKGLAVEAGVPIDDDTDWGIVDDRKAFVNALARHRNWARATDPPLV